MPTPRRSDNQSMTHSYSETIDTIALDDFDESVDFIKIDIEGMEDQALRGAKLVFEKSKPVVFIEILKTDKVFVLDFFKNHNYRGFQVGDNLLALPEHWPIQIQGLHSLF